MLKNAVMCNNKCESSETKERSVRYYYVELTRMQIGFIKMI